MIKIWRNQIWLGNKTFKQCPMRYKVGVEQLMRDDVENQTMTSSGVHTAEEFEEKTGIPFYEEVEVTHV